MMLDSDRAYYARLYRQGVEETFTTIRHHPFAHPHFEDTPWIKTVKPNEAYL